MAYVQEVRANLRGVITRGDVDLVAGAAEVDNIPNHVAPTAVFSRNSLGGGIGNIAAGLAAGTNPNTHKLSLLSSDNTETSNIAYHIVG